MANLTWGRTKELLLLHILQLNKVDVAVITEAELPEMSASSFAIDGFVSFPAGPSKGKVRLLVLIRSSLAIGAKAAVSKTIPNSVNDVTIWIEMTLKHSLMVIGGIYRPWTGTAQEGEHLAEYIKQLSKATQKYKHVLVCGDFNLDQNRREDTSYNRRKLLQVLVDGTDEAGLHYHPTPSTWQSHGKFDGKHKVSCIDHVYSYGFSVSVSVLSDATTDHRPVLAAIDMSPNRGDQQLQERRNFSKIGRNELMSALEDWPWSDIYVLENEEKIHDFILKGVTAALDRVAPLRIPKPAQREDLYLSKETLRAMEKRDLATSRPAYRVLRNKVTSLVRRDRLNTNLTKLTKAKGDPKVLWNLANQALGKAGRTPLPASINIEGTATTDKRQAAEGMNQYYIDKIEKLRSKLPTTPSAPPTLAPSAKKFEFKFANAGRTARIIKGLGNTTALGNDGIPASVWKMGVDCLAGPVSHLINRSLANGRVPQGFKKGKVIPVYKGKGKSVVDPASYRPVSLLPALSKVLELVVKEDLENFLQLTNGLPNSQFGFRSGRSTTTAVAAAHGSWLKAKQEGEMVAILAFDFSAAFDTVDPAALIEKLARLGVVGKRESSWFLSYMTGGQQSVEWDSVRSKPLEVKYGVRQGSILGPLLFLTIMADLPTALGINSDCIVGYADDVCLWATGKDKLKLKEKLEKTAAAFVNFANYNALSLNPSKTQLLLTGTGSHKMLEGFSVRVDDAVITPGKSLDLLGVSFDTTLSSRPYGCDMARAARHRSALVARLGAHLPEGHYLQQLAGGIISGKICYAAAAMAPTRISDDDPLCDSARSVQIAMNDAARVITGNKRADKLRIGDLLLKAKMPSYNQLAVRATAIETWKAFHSSDGKDGDRNPLGLLMFGSRFGSGLERRSTRAAEDGKICQSVYLDCMVSRGTRIWNLSSELRNASTFSSAISAARGFAAQCPI